MKWNDTENKTIFSWFGFAPSNKCTRNPLNSCFWRRISFQSAILDIEYLTHDHVAILRITIFILCSTRTAAKFSHQNKMRTLCVCFFFHFCELNHKLSKTIPLLADAFCAFRIRKQCKRSSNACPTSDTMLPTHLFIGGARTFPHIFSISIEFNVFLIRQFHFSIFPSSCLCSCSLCECLFCLRILAALS